MKTFLKTIFVAVFFAGVMCGCELDKSHHSKIENLIPSSDKTDNGKQEIPDTGLPSQGQRPERVSAI